VDSARRAATVSPNSAETETEAIWPEAATQAGRSGGASPRPSVPGHCCQLEICVEAVAPKASNGMSQTFKVRPRDSLAP
jgi:hypothetical protein